MSSRAFAINLGTENRPTWRYDDALLERSSSRGNPLGRGRLSELWSGATDGMVLPDRSGWHDLRHHHASLLIAAGRSPRAVADRLGHGDPSMTLKVYSHLWGDDQSRILEAIEGAYSSSVTAPE